MKQPARLGKVEKNNDYSYFFSSIMDKVEAWCLRHATLCLFVLMALMIALFTVLIYAIVGVSATDSGVQYNAFQRII